MNEPGGANLNASQRILNKSHFGIRFMTIEFWLRALSLRNVTSTDFDRRVGERRRRGGGGGGGRRRVLASLFSNIL